MEHDNPGGKHRQPREDSGARSAVGMGSQASTPCVLPEAHHWHPGYVREGSSPFPPGLAPSALRKERDALEQQWLCGSNWGLVPGM